MAARPGIWGIDLGLCALKAIRVEYVDGAPKATAFDYIEHPKILSQPDADPDQLTREALEQFLSRNSLKGDTVVISVAGQSGLARFVKLPPVEERKIADIVRFEAKQQIPFPLDEVVWDFQKIGTPMVTDGLALETEIGLFAMKKDMVNRALAQFKDVNVEVHVIQMAPLALINYLAYDSLGIDPKAPGDDSEPVKHDCVVALDMGTDNSNLVITDGDRIIWQRAIPLGGNHFTRALTKDMKLTFAKAEHLKRNAVKSPDLRKILASLKTVLSDFVGEVQRSLGYFTNTHRDATIKYMVGLGGGFRLPGLQKFLQEKLQLEVKKISKFERLNGDEVTVSPQFNENILSFAVPYGLALQGLKLAKLQTNLLPHDIRTERLVRGKKPWAAAAAAALLVAAVGVAYGKHLEKAAVTGPAVKKTEDDVKNLKMTIESNKKQYEAAEAKLDQSRDSLRRLTAGSAERFNWQLMAQFINLTLPQPNGNRLADKSSRAVPVKDTYYTEDARKAFELLEQRRTPTRLEKQKIDPALTAKEDEFIKKHLVQISIEGIHALYTEDVPSYFKNIYKEAEALKEMTDEEAAVVKMLAGKQLAELTEEQKKKVSEAKVPEKAWVVEIRGYTYHNGGESFIKNTLVENLRRPEIVNPEIFKSLFAKTRHGRDDVPMSDKEKAFQDQILNQISFLFLFKNEEVINPIPGQFEHIRGSHLARLTKSVAAPAGPPPAAGGPPPADGGAQAPPPPQQQMPKVGRDSWRPAGEIASLAHGAGAGALRAIGIGGGDLKAAKNKGGAAAVERQRRREFVVLFLWREPLRTLEAAPPPPEKKDP